MTTLVWISAIFQYLWVRWSGGCVATVHRGLSPFCVSMLGCTLDWLMIIKQDATGTDGWVIFLNLVQVSQVCTYYAGLICLRSVHDTTYPQICLLFISTTSFWFLELNAGWWFGTFFMFPSIGDNHPNWLSYFFRGAGIPPTRQSIYHILIIP